MKDKEYSLQLLHHAEVFATRELAVQYVNEEFKNKALIAEPAVVFYGDAAKPNVIVAVADGNHKVFLIDTANLEEQINETSAQSDENNINIAALTTALREVVDQVGLVWDENKRTEQITYEPDSRDELIGNAENVAEAISAISTFVQSQFKENHLSLSNSESVMLTFADAPDGGKMLTANVKISEYGADDLLKFNDNIIGLKNDGLYVAANLVYEEENHRLVFTTSGMRNGRFVDDANVQVIDLGEHTQYTPDNTDHTVKLTVDADKNTISGDVKISGSSNNILVAQDGKLLVDGRASNIKYKDNDVFSVLNKVEHDIESLNDDIENINNTHFVEGDETDTMIVTAAKQPLGNYKVSGNVRLGENKTIKVIEGGLEVDLDITSDLTANQLIVRLGNTEKKINLPGIQLLSDVRYDASTRAIVVYTTDGKHFSIPVGDLIATWVVDNGTLNPIVLTKTTSTTSAPDSLRAELKISTKSGNILGVDEQGKLLADSTALDTKIEGEISRAKAAENANANAIADHVLSMTQTVADIAENVSGVKAELVDAIGAVDNKVAVLTEHISNNDSEIADIVTRLNGVDTQISDINSDIATINTNAATTKNLADTNKLAIEHLDGKMDSMESRMDAVETSVSTHHANYDALKDKVDGNFTKIGAIETKVNAEIARATDAEGVINTELSLAKAEIVRVENKLDHVKEDLDSRMSSIEDALGSGVDDALAEAKAYTDAEVGKHIVDTNNAVATAKRDAIDIAKEYADDKIALSLEEAKAYTDAEKTRAQSAETANAEAIVALQQRDAELTTAVNSKVSHVEIVKNSMSDLQYMLKVDGVDAGEINIPKDQFLKNVNYNDASKELNFTFVTTDGETTSTIGIADLVDTYEAGDGLSLADNKFSVKVSAGSEAYLSVDEDGVKLVGIDTALATKADKSDVYTKAEADNLFLTVHQDISALATKAEVNTLSEYADEISAKANANEIALMVVNGNEAEPGSIKKALKDAKTYTDDAIGAVNANVATKAEAADVYTKTQIDNKGYLVAADLSDITTEVAKKVEKVEIVKNSMSDLQYILRVNDIDVSEINIPKDQFLDDVTYSEAEKKIHFHFTTTEGAKETIVDIADLVDTYEAGDGLVVNDNVFSVNVSAGSEAYLSVGADGIKLVGIDTALATKADKSDVYTKAQIDAMGFLTHHQDISMLAAKTEVNEVATKANENKAEIDAIKIANASRDASIATLESEAIKLSLSAVQGLGITNNVSKSNVGTTITSSLKLRNSASNILELDNDGLYANVELSYNKTTNTLTFNNGSGVVNYELSETSLVRNAYYDGANKELVISLTKPDGDSEIRIPANDFIRVVEIENGDDSPVSLKKTNNGDVDVISADLVISEEAGNLIKAGERSLYASAMADDHIAHWVDEDISVQGAIERLRSKTQHVDALLSDMAESKGRLTDLEYKVAALQQSNAAISQDIETVLTKIAQCEAKVASYDLMMANMAAQFDELRAYVNSWGTRVNNVETLVETMHDDVDEVKRQLSDEDDDETIAARLKAAEYELDNLVDFGMEDEEEPVAGA